MPGRKRGTLSAPNTKGAKRSGTVMCAVGSIKCDEVIPKWLREYQEMFPVQPAARLNPTPDSFKIHSKGYEILDFGSSMKNC